MIIRGCTPHSLARTIHKRTGLPFKPGYEGIRSVTARGARAVGYDKEPITLAELARCLPIALAAGAGIVKFSDHDHFLDEIDANGAAKAIERIISHVIATGGGDLSADVFIIDGHGGLAWLRANGESAHDAAGAVSGPAYVITGEKLVQLIHASRVPPALTAIN